MARVTVSAAKAKSKSKPLPIMKYEIDPKFTCNRADCIYRARIKGAPNKCDFMFLTGQSRIRVCGPGHEKPADCTQYLSKDTEAGKLMLEMIKEEQIKRRGKKTENPCFDCTDKQPGCNCEKRRIYWADKGKEYQKRLTDAGLNAYLCDALLKNKRTEKQGYWEPYRDND